LLSKSGRRQVQELIDHYMGNADLLRKALSETGFKVFGGEHAPYIWVGCPAGEDSWSVFDRVLKEANVVITPGAGFGRAGEGYFRVSAFNSRENVEEVAKRLVNI
jgi:LL-diaminopimelate aminotransferase